jgi:hypothetical protein
VHLYFIDGQSIFFFTLCRLLTSPLGVSDRLAEQITNGLPDDVLQSFVELYCNFWRKCPAFS